MEIVIALVVLLVVLGVGFIAVRSRRRAELPPAPEKPEILPGVNDDASEPRDTPLRDIEDISLDGAVGTAVLEPPTPTVEQPAPALGRMARLRARLARSNTALGKGLLALLSSGKLDDATWEEIEDTLLVADVGIAGATDLVERLKTRVKVEGTEDPEHVRQMLREELLVSVDPGLDRSLNTVRIGADPSVVLVVGVNGTGKTTTTGKLARLLVAEDQDVVLGAADTFRAAATQQLQTWGERVGVPVIHGPEGSDPASVAYDAVSAGIETEADVVVVDTAGRLHTKTGLMDELGKVKRVVEKQVPVSEVLLVLDATTGQNGMTQARVFSEVVAITGIVLTKLDGTAKGGIVISVQRELGVPVKLVGLGEGPDDLAPFDPTTFVDALIEA
ncbi:MAG: signal recognition particle-docking protein FtsY [Candidatus Nanopelagicales bacterium]